MTATAYGHALKLLGRRSFFESELVERLRSAGYPDAEVASAVARCRAADFVDDAGVAARFVEVRGPERGWGPRRLEAELRRRGCPVEVARSAIAAVDVRAAAMNTALRRAETRAKPDWWRDGDLRVRMVSSLIRRGFDADEARSAVGSLAIQREREHDALDDEPRDPEHLP